MRSNNTINTWFLQRKNIVVATTVDRKTRETLRQAIVAIVRLATRSTYNNKTNGISLFWTFFSRIFCARNGRFAFVRDNLSSNNFAILPKLSYLRGMTCTRMIRPLIFLDLVWSVHFKEQTLNLQEQNIQLRVRNTPSLSANYSDQVQTAFIWCENIW